MDILDKINRLRKRLNAVILAHYYQESRIQDIADFVGDSLALAKKAAETSADVIVFAGVHFMAETAKILNPDKPVLLPDMDAGCSLADSCPADKFKEFIERHPDHTVVTYVNCSAEVKALSDILCTSTNAVKVINSIPPDKPIIFAPDKHLGKFLMKRTGRDLLLWDGTCVVHETFSEKKLVQLKVRYPEALVVAHPECPEQILDLADHVGSTSSLLNFVCESSARQFIVVTEPGILHQMKLRNPNKEFIAAPSEDEGECACNECPYMKLNTLEKLASCMENMSPQVDVPMDTIEKAMEPLNRMLSLG
ncbi:MAG: quinolinate synthase NadA [Candidatus Dadabacteria bacterium]|nr:MAG: quinolinate synthase NadA [Candidatus Dadabacteria bacterium]